MNRNGHYEIQPVMGSTLPAVAKFLQSCRQNETGVSFDWQHRCESAPGIERRLRWLLCENPVAVEGAPLGYCLRDSAGIVRGLTLTCPAAFLYGNRRLHGLSSGSFFVDRQARSMGFYLFRKYLQSPGYSFFFATTCNANSGGLWSQMGGSAVPDSDVEYFLPLRLDVLMPSLVATRTSNEVATAIAGIGGHLANPILRVLTRPAAQLKIERCYDLEKLSELSRRNRPAEFISGDRSAAFLRWRYGKDAPLYPYELFLFRDTRGNEGWFSLANMNRGEQGQIRATVLLDVSWPRGKVDFDVVFHEIVRMAAPASDAVFFRSQPGVDYRQHSRWVMTRRLPCPRAFVVTPKSAPPLPLDVLDYDDGEYGAWAFPWPATRESADAARTVTTRSKTLPDSAMPDMRDLIR